MLKDKLHILFVSSEFPRNKNEATGGIGTYLLNITEGLVAKGHKVTVVTKGFEKNSYSGVKVEYINSHRIEQIKSKIKNKLLVRILNFIQYPLLFSLGVYFKIKQLEKSGKIDIIEGNDFGGELFFYLLLKRKRLPVVLRLHTPSFIIQKYNNESSNLFYKYMKFLEVYCLKKADSLYSPTKSLSGIIEKQINCKVARVIPYPFKPAFKIKGIKREKNTILYVGKLQPKKGIFNLIKAAVLVIKKYPQAKFIFAGPDTKWQGKSVKQSLIEECRLNNIFHNVQFVNELKKKDIYKLYCKSAITVIPSIWENFPNVSLEAMVNGSLVLANKVGGLIEIINNGKNGVLVDILRYSKLAKSLIYYLKQDTLRARLIKKAKDDIRNNYNSNHVTNSTVLYYKTLLGKAS